ncbi:MAG TPA: glycosyltransferase family 2 protein [Desulfuromonadaceae bacterium]
MIGITLAVHNKLEYTRICLESLYRTLPPEATVVVVDNASGDGTAEYLESLPWLTVISNQENRGCAPAWNQGVQAAGGDWTVVLNNDIVLTEGWWQGLVSAAERWRLDIVSPAIREGELNYDLAGYSREFTGRMAGVVRRGTAHAICFAARRRVFETIGPFDENFRIGQYEDTDFFLRAAKAGFRLGRVGGAFLHHYGSVTQDAIRKTRTVNRYALENKAYFIRKWKLPWWKRAAGRNWSKLVNWLHCRRERLLHRHSLVEKWLAGRLRYF